MEREVFVTCAQTGDEMILEGLDRAFGGVATMSMRWHQLEFYFGFVEESLQQGGYFIVEDVEFRSESAVDEVVAQLFEGCLQGGVGTIFDGFGEHGIAVIIAEDHDVLVALR